MGEGKLWQEIAADMIEANGFKISGDADEATVNAAAFVFDQGILYLPPSGKAEIVVALRRAALNQEDSNAG